MGLDIFGIEKRARKRAAVILEESRKGQKAKLDQHRAFAAAQMTNLLSGWSVETKKLDADIKAGLRSLRGRSRDASQNNDYGRKYLQLLRTNVVGPAGIRMQPRSKNQGGKLDKAANALVAAAWDKWNKRGNFDITGKLSGVDGQNMFIESVGRDGEVLVYKVRNANNPFKFAVQFLDPDLLDEKFSLELAGGRSIRMGIEFDADGKPVAYHLTQVEATQDSYYSGGKYRRRVPAKDIIHSFRQERAHQTRGYPWTSAALIEMHHLSAFQEAAIVASRLGASTMGFFTEDMPDAGFEGDGTDALGNIVSEAEPGMFHKLPPGVDFKEFKPGYPDSFYDAAVKRFLKGIASGLQVSYTSLASDPESTNFSAMRGEVMAERDNWRSVQGWMISDFLDPLFVSWLDHALLTGEIPLPYSRFDKLAEVQWMPRAWGWVDPVKDITALKLAMGENLKSPTRACAEQGINFEDELNQIAEDRKKMSDLGLLPGGENDRKK